ncbi:MAG: hypothetical protein IPK60_01225 [Sandaracinaceae bacterium]|nr:hypothetical protein [Sandaracinaceae bacterium]
MSDETLLPPCGIYQTTKPIGEVPAGRFVYFHNHGNPGPGIYLPSRWVRNRAEFHAQGTTLHAPEDIGSLRGLAGEGLYRVLHAFDCCEKNCMRFEEDTLVTLGYDGNAGAILFSPEMIEGALVIPEQGTRIDDTRISNLRRLLVKEPRTAESTHRVVH